MLSGLRTEVGELLASRELLVNLTLRDLRGRFRRSFLGWTWTIVNPLMAVLIYSVVFHFLLKIKVAPGQHSGLNNFALFLVCGLLPWTFFQGSLTGSVNILLANASLIQRVFFRREVLVLSAIGTGAVTFLIELGVVSVIFLAMGNFVLPWIPVVLVIFVLETMFVAGLALMLSPINVYFRDTEYLLNVLLQLFFYAVPVIYPVSLVPRHVHFAGLAIPTRLLYDLNPLTQFVQAIRYCLYDLRLPPVHDLLYLVGWTVVSLSAGAAVFRRLEPRLAEEV